MRRCLRGATNAELMHDDAIREREDKVRRDRTETDRSAREGRRQD